MLNYFTNYSYNVNKGNRKKKGSIKIRKKSAGFVFIFNFVLISLIVSNIFSFDGIFDEHINGIEEDPSLPSISSSNPPNKNYFKYYKIITINPDQVSGTGIHTNFPLMISIFDSDLRYDVQSDGDDIRFAINNTWLNHEIELFDQSFNGTHAKLVAWVSIPSLSTTTNTEVSIYYGNSTMSAQENPEDVWDSNYKGVWHLSEEPTGSLYDSTTNDIDGTSSGSMTGSDQIDGQVGGCLDFDGADDYIDFGNPLALQLTGAMTVELWFKAHYFGNTYLVSKNGKSGQRGWDVSFDDINSTHGLVMFRYALNGEGHADEVGNITIAIDQWYHVVGVFNPSTYSRFFLNGVMMEENTTNIISAQYDAPNPVRFGTRGDAPPPNYYDGIIDEVRISDIARSADWIATEYNNQFDPSSFYTVGEETILTPPNVNYFNHYKVITIDHTKVAGSNNLINFPVLISIFDTDLRNEVQPDGDDIAFAYNSIWLAHEIELFNQTYNSTHAQLTVWVRVPSLSPSVNTNISMYYGNSTMSSQQNPTGVWDSNYVAVWHMNQDPSSSNILDSTSNNNDLNTAGFASDQRLYNGKVGTAIAFDGINDYLSINSFSGPTDGFTFETWFKFDEEYTVGDGEMYLFSGNTPSWGNNMPRVRFRSLTGSGVGSVATALDSSDSCDGTKTVWAANTWFHYAFRFSVPIKTTTLYLNGTVDGIKVDSDLAVPHSDWNMLSIASDYGANVWGSGAISEFRILKTALSTEWIVTEYNNQYDPTSFFTVGPEEKDDNTPPTYSNLIESSVPLELGETETITINVSDPSGISRSLIEFEGSNHSMTNIYGDTWQYDSWTPSSVGNYTYTIWMEDNYNNWNSTIGTIEVIDTISPTYSDLIESADPLKFGQNQTIIIKVYDSPGSGVNQTLLEYESTNHTMNFIGGNTWSWTYWKPSTPATHTYRIFMQDMQNNWNMTAGNFTVITTAAPFIGNLTESPDPLELGQDILITVDVYDNETYISTVLIDIGGFNYTMQKNLVKNNSYNIMFIYGYNLTNPSVGTVLFTIYANDTDNNWNSYLASFDIVDTTPPTFSTLTIIEDTIELGNNLIVSINCTDLTNINRVLIELEGNNNSMTNIGGDKWEYDLWIPSSAGNHSYTIWIEDNNSNWNYSSNAFMVQDTTTPTYSDLYETPGPIEIGDSLTISINSTDLSGIKDVSIEFRNSNHTMTNIGGDIWQYNSWMQNSIGNYTYKIYITDNNDNLNSLSDFILFQDTIIPVYSNLFESADPLELGDSAIIRIRIYDFAGINRSLLEFEGSNHSMTNIYGDTWQYDLWTPNYWILHQYTIHMKDKSGNWNFVIANITVQDTTPPPSPVLTNSPSGDVSGILVFDWSDGSDPSGISYYFLIIDNETDPFATPGYVYIFNITNSGTQSSYYELSENLKEGTYYFFLSQIDGTGHQSSYTMGTFTIVPTNNGPGNTDFLIVIIIGIIFASVAGLLLTGIIVRRRTKKEVLPQLKKISIKPIVLHVDKILRSSSFLKIDTEKFKIKKKETVTIGEEHNHDDKELESRLNEIKTLGEELMDEGAYLEALKQFELAREILSGYNRKEEAELYSELIVGIKGLIEERERRFAILEQEKVQGNSVRVYELYNELMDISEKLRDLDAIQMYQSELMQFFQNDEKKALDLEKLRDLLEKRADSLIIENYFEESAKIYEKCENVSLFLVQLGKEEETINVKSFRDKKVDSLEKRP